MISFSVYRTGGAMFRKFFSRKKPLDDAVKLRLAEAIAVQLILQKNMAETQAAIDDRNGNLKLRALGYVYGYIDAALRTDGHDIADTSIGGPITYHVLRRLWPDRVNDCMRALLANLRVDQQMMAAIMHGRQQCLDLRKPGASDVPMDLARFLIEGDEPRGRR
jgi:hypothetical protein